MIRETFSHFVQALNVDFQELTRNGVRVSFGRDTIITGNTQETVFNDNWKLVSSPMSLDLYYSPDGIVPHVKVSSLASIDLENENATQISNS